MKIIMLSNTFGSVTTTFIRNEAYYFSKNYDFVYLTQKVEGFEKEVKIKVIPYMESSFMRKFNWFLWQMDIKCSFKNKKYAQQLNEFIKNEKPNVVHCHFGYEALSFLQNINKEFKLSVFVSFHGYDASQMLRKKSYVTALKNSFAKKNIFPIVISEKIRNNLKGCGIDMSNSRLLHCGIDLDKFNVGQSLKVKSEEIVFIQNSSLVEKKGHEYTLKAFALFFNNNPEYKSKVKVIFTGDGVRREQLEKYSIELGISNNVQFVGNVNHDQLVEVLRNSDIFVHHSITAQNGDEEGIPTAIMEAMAMELPILSSFHAGIPELVKNGVNGLLCEEKDVETFALQIREIIGWSRLSKNRTVIETDFNMIKHNQQLEGFYLGAIKNN